MNAILLLMLIQLITESLPISSSSHVRIFGLILEKLGIASVFWHASFDFLLHGSMLIVVSIFFFKAWYSPFYKAVQGLCRLVFKKKVNDSWYKLLQSIAYVCFLQSVVLGIVSSCYFLIVPIIKKTDWFKHPLLLVLGLLVTSIELLSLVYKPKKLHGVFGLREAVVLGCVQGVALLPGISRFASSYVAACWLGIASRRAFQIAFAVEVPMLLGAFLLDGIPFFFAGNCYNYGNVFELGIVFFVGTILSFCALWLSWLMAEKNIFWLFGFYMVLPIFIVSLLTLF